MNELLWKALDDETHEARTFLVNLEKLEKPINPLKVKDFFEFIMQISTKTLSVQQLIYGKLMSAGNDPMFIGMSDEQKERFTKQLEEMTRAKSQKDVKRGQSETHFGLLCAMYETLYPGSAADYIIANGHNRENPYLLELEIIDALYRTAKQKVTAGVALLQVLQYLEPFIIRAMKNIVTKAVNTEGVLIYPDALPRYITEHEAKEYHNKPILLSYYENEDAERIITGYCQRMAHIFDEGFFRLNYLLFPQTHSNPDAEPRLAEE